MADYHNRKRALAIQRLLFRRGSLAPSVSRATATGARCCAHCSGAADFRQYLSSVGIDHSVGEHLVQGGILKVFNSRTLPFGFNFLRLSLLGHVIAPWFYLS